jgi:Family of unknown function (DUF6353)
MKFVDITRAASKAVLEAKQASPQIMFVAGLIGVTTATVLASRATLGKNLDILEDIKLVQSETYTDDKRTQDKIIVMSTMAIDVVKLYGPAIIVGGLGVACLTGSHNILVKRNAALTAAYVGLERTYKVYRQRVQEEVGAEKEAQLHYEAATTVAKQEDTTLNKLAVGRKKPIPGYSPYAKFFDEMSTQWQRNPETNMFFLKLQETLATEKLQRKGYLFLNEVYQALGLPLTQAGCVVGWTMYSDGDAFVDFGIFDHHTQEIRNFVNGANPSVLLDFNVEGIIADKIER